MKYFNLSVLILLLLLSAFAAFDSWRILQIPTILGYFYNPALEMYEPIQASFDPQGLELLLVPFSMMLYPFTMASPLYQVLYFPTALWVSLVYICPYVLNRRLV